MVDSAPEVDSALLGSTVGTLLSVYEGLGTVSVFSAMLGPLQYMLCVSHLVLLVRQRRKLWISAVAVHCRSSISCRSAEADSHGLAFGRP